MLLFNFEAKHVFFHSLHNLKNIACHDIKIKIPKLVKILKILKYCLLYTFFRF